MRRTPSQTAYMRTQEPTSTPRSVGQLSAQQFERLRDLLATYSGVYLDTARQRVLEQGLEQRLAATGDALTTYERRISSREGRDELRQLAELVLNHETFFFRNKPHMRALQEVLLPELHRRKPLGAPIRIWSAGCSTGEEPYSLAIAAIETLGRYSGRAIEIWATDLSMAALKYARRGYYHGRSLTNVTPDQLKRYFQPQGDGYLVGEQIRSLVRFDLLNLLEPLPEPAQGVDIIFCQNVMIYFQLETTQKILERMYRCLPEGGLLFLGFSETLWNVFDGFRSREVLGSFVYYKEAYKPAVNVQQKPPSAEAGHTTRRHEPKQAVAHAQPKPANRRRVTESVTNRRSEELHHQTLKIGAQGAPVDAELLQRGRELLAQNHADAALDVLRRISPRSIYAPEAIILIARCHADRGELDTAAAEARRAVEIDAMNEEGYILLGALSSRQGQWAGAIEQFERARYLNPASPLVSYYLAEAYRQHSKIEASVREYRNVLRKLDGHPPDSVLDGVAVGWLRETCQRQLERFSHRT